MCLPAAAGAPCSRAPSCARRAAAPRGDLDRQALVLHVRRRARPRSRARRVEARGDEVVQARHLRGRPGVGVEHDAGQVAVDVAPLLGHEVVAQLAGVVTQPWDGAAGQQQQPHVLERVAAQDDGAGPAPATCRRRRRTRRRRRARRASVSTPQHAAVGAQVEVAGRQRLRHPGQPGIPALVVEGPERAAPGAVGGGGVAVVGHAVDARGRRVGVQAQRAGRLAVKRLAHAERAQRRQRVVGWRAARTGSRLASPATPITTSS